MKKTMEIRVEDILGRELLGGNHQHIGRIEELRAHVTPDGCVIREVVIGMLGLLERLDLGARQVVGVDPKSGCIAQWEQIDFTNPAKPRLIVDVDALVKL